MGSLGALIFSVLLVVNGCTTSQLSPLERVILIALGESCGANNVVCSNTSTAECHVTELAKGITVTAASPAASITLFRLLFLSVSGPIQVHNSSIDTIDLPVLKTVSGVVNMTGNVLLKSVNLATSVQSGTLRGVYLANNKKLEAVFGSDVIDGSVVVREMKR
jgi:hypothetical protein